MEYTIYDNKLETADFIRLFAAVGWGNVPFELAQTSLQNSYAVFSAAYEDRVIAMARLLGDGGMAFFLRDLAVAPEFQGQGIGRALICHIEEYIREQLRPGWEGYFQLVSAKGKEGFYIKQGYRSHPNEDSGAAMSKWIVKE